MQHGPGPRFRPTCAVPTPCATRLGAQLALGLLLAACGAPQKVTELDPIEFKVDRSAGDKRVYVKDFAELSRESMARFEAGEHAEALRLFDLLVKEFPQDERLRAVQYNAGLALLRLQRPAEAADRFADAMRRAAGTRDARDALFLLAEALDKAGKPKEGAAVLRGALEDEQVKQQIGGALGLLDELEATARMGIALRKAQDITKADEAFKRVERIYQDHRELNLVRESEWVARSLYERGEIYRELFTSIRFKLPVERMKRDLEDKANLFLKAESAYYQCVRLHQKDWSLAAGFEIGHLYTQLIEDVDHAEAPPEVGPEIVDVYRDELWNHTERLAKRAVVIYRKNIELAERLGQTDSEWVRRSEAGLGRMEQLIEQNTQRRVRLMTQTGAAPQVRPPPAGEPAPELPQ